MSIEGMAAKTLAELIKGGRSSAAASDNARSYNWRAVVEPGSRFEEALFKTGHYVSPRLIEEINDGMLALATMRCGGPGFELVGDFSRNAGSDLYLDTVNGRGDVRLKVDTYGMPPDEEKAFVATLDNFIKQHNIQAWVGGNSIFAKNVEDVCRVLCDGFINPNLSRMGLRPVDYQALLAEKPLSALQMEPPAQMQTPQQQQQARHQAAWSERTAGGVSSAAGGRAAS